MKTLLMVALLAMSGCSTIQYADCDHSCSIYGMACAEVRVNGNHIYTVDTRKGNELIIKQDIEDYKCVPPQTGQAQSIEKYLKETWNMARKNTRGYTPPSEHK